MLQCRGTTRIIIITMLALRRYAPYASGITTYRRLNISTCGISWHLTTIRKSPLAEAATYVCSSSSVAFEAQVPLDIESDRPPLVEHQMFSVFHDVEDPLTVLVVLQHQLLGLEVIRIHGNGTDHGQEDVTQSLRRS